MIKRIFLFFCLLCFIVSSLFMAGCGKQANESAQQAAEKETVQIVTSFYPIYIDVINITYGVPGVEVTNMTKPQTGCLHDYQLTTEDMKTLEKADIFVVNGAGMESFLDKIIKMQKNLKIIDASQGIQLLKDEKTGEENPHVWLSISKNQEQVKNITRQLKDADPGHAEAYQKNCDRYIASLENLDREMHLELDSLPHKDIVTFHEAFPYFADEFGLHIESVIEREPGSAPSPAELELTIDQVKSLPVKVLFTEPQYSPAAAEIIAKETGAKIYSLDPIVTGEAGPQAKDDYLVRMKKNMETLKEALQ